MLRCIALLRTGVDMKVLHQRNAVLAIARIDLDTRYRCVPFHYVFHNFAKVTQGFSLIYDLAFSVYTGMHRLLSNLIITAKRM